MDRVIIVMGVAGSGKTTVGKLLAGRLGIPFIDADDHHPAENVAKMRSGIPLTDADREPWLRTLAALIDTTLKSGSAVVACSALKERYRTILKGSNGDRVRFVYLKGSRDLLQQRIELRSGHFMPPALLESQLSTLEEPLDAIVAGVDEAPEQICAGLEAVLQKEEHNVA